MVTKPPAEDASKQSGRLKPDWNGALDGGRWERASQISIVGLFVNAILWCAYLAQHVIVPVLLAWSIATIVLPIVKWIEGKGVPRVVAAIAVTVLLIVLFLSLILLLSAPLTYWLGRASYITWFWGPIGAFLAVPLLMALSVTLEHVFSEEKPALPD
jgi:predicted PurR-regulated permease PerM